MKRGNRKTIIVISIVILIAVLICILLIFVPKPQENEESRAAIESMEEMIPYFGADYNYASGMGRDPLPVMTINDTDLVGAIEIPSLDLRAPVTDKGVKKAYFARWASGSPVKGKFRIMGNQNDVFSRITRGKPGETVIFTDMDGTRYEYTITTQFHLKDWAKADNDLMLCYKVDSDTKFVLGCTKAD